MGEKKDGCTSLQDQRLLNILLSKVGMIRLNGVEEFGTDRRYTLEELCWEEGDESASTKIRECGNTVLLGEEE